jgi:hypothetical protein
MIVIISQTKIKIQCFLRIIEKGDPMNGVSDGQAGDKGGRCFSGKECLEEREESWYAVCVTKGSLQRKHVRGQ